ncbi:NAD(P)/FAD-dependent oxidoreductase [Metallumcola ferriviriculae]|uniref:NAD(P)/FAD-dependent oxidoreductase n=2 Tax=Metallumcola ferriviriculae TaxID=3039180 RepID=A0AAU0UR48_9FIRM|nr:NAD(P)/FAD-dependent oxidoreductase [Desulfitibacteraceae bacterium MK1]
MVVNIYDVVVIGGGAAGMMAAIQAGLRGREVLLLEKNNRLGKKLLITGNGRCNITNSTPIEDMIGQVPGNGRFLYSAFYTFDNNAVLDFFHRQGVPTKEERGGRIFPRSDRARDVVDGLARALRQAGVEVMMGQSVEAVIPRAESSFTIRTSETEYTAGKVIIAVGGASCPRTGSSGDAYPWVREMGHKVTPILPALIPLVTQEKWVPQLQGLSLKNVCLTARQGKRKLGEEFGEMLFTHFGLSGPIVLTLSRAVAHALNKGARVTVELNLKPALTPDKLDQRLIKDFKTYARKQFKNALDDLLPKMLIPVIIQLSAIDAEKPVHQITQEERKSLVVLLQCLTMTVSATRPLAEAIVTSGGVSVKEIDPSTMESRLVPGLYFAGEVMDIDAYTGGYNLQAAWSTGYVAGNSI